MILSRTACRGLLFAVLCLPHVAQASAWGQQSGNLFLSLQPYYYSTNSFFDASGDRHSRGGNFTKYEINPYLEYGLTEKDTLSCNMFYNWLSDDSSGETLHQQGFTDQELGWQRQLWQDLSQVLAVQAVLIVPAGYDLEEQPYLGYDRFGMEWNMRYGRSGTPFAHNAYIDLRLGVRHYFGYPSSQARVDVNAGVDITPTVQFLLLNELHYSLNDGDEKIINGTELLQGEYSLLKTTVAIRYRFDDRYSLVAGGFRHIWGENAGAGGGGYVSLYLQF